MKDYCKNVNVFHGNGKIDLPAPDGIAASWFFVKAICGNTHPGAAVPFGRMTVCSYTGGYPTGYGNHRGNSDPWNLRTFGEKPLCRGFSHFHQSGTGSMCIYYNYAVTTPFYGNLADAAEPKEMLLEDARPGYYSTKLSFNNILCELTTNGKTAVHRYTFPGNAMERAGRIALDLSNDGFINDDPNARGYSESSEIKLCGDNALEAEVIMKGVKLYIYAQCSNAKASYVWRDYLPLSGENSLSLGNVRENFGVLFDVPKEGTSELRLSVSVMSMEAARKNVQSETRSFDEIAADAYDLWNDALSKIEIEAPTERDRDIFYSNFYQSIIKPNDWSGENFIFDSETLMLDFSTLWDMYKTQMPLLMTLFPDIGEKIISTFVGFGEKFGYMPHTLNVSDAFLRERSEQARMLAAHTVFDAYCRGIRGDYEKAVKIAEKELFGKHYDSFRDGTCVRATHYLDIADGCAAMSRLAGEIGIDTSVFDRYKDCWREVFDEKTGLMKVDSDYYEGTNWNYSFRPLWDMTSRVALAGGKEGFAALLDRFFGFTHSEDKSARFEGYNNQSDMEAPAAYHFADRHDRISEVSSACVKYIFSDGRGGLPGNNDSGGLSTCYMWTAMGLLPVSGQDLVIIGSPLMNRTVMHLPRGVDFTVRRVGSGIYVRRASLNGAELESLCFKASEMMKGGELLLEMSEMP